MRSRRFGTAVAVTCLAGSLVVAGATPAVANTCATATPMGPGGTEMGSVTVHGAVGALTPDDWWEHATTAVNRLVTLQAPTGGRVTLTVYATDCTTVLCGPLDSPAACTASNLPAGTLKIKVSYSPLGGQPATNYSLTASGWTATECNDTVDNDGDGQVDYGQDPHCTSGQDNTEAPIRVAVWGHITIYINSAGQVSYVLTGGLYDDASQFSCSLSTTGTVEVTCTEQFNPEIEYECTRFVLTATAPSPHRAASGTVAAYVRCASGAELRTAPVVGSGSRQADSSLSGVNLGRASTIVCRAEGATHGSRPSGSWQVDCTEPGVAWPFPSPRPI